MCVGKLIATKSQLQRGVETISKLAQVRKAKGLSQDRLAELSGVSRITISRIESGNESPRVRTLVLLSRALKVKLTDILEKAG